LLDIQRTKQIFFVCR